MHVSTAVLKHMQRDITATSDYGSVQASGNAPIQLVKFAWIRHLIKHTSQNYLIVC